MLKKALIIILLGVILLIMGKTLLPKIINKSQPKTDSNPSAVEDKSARIVSTKPDPIDNNIIGATDTIEITFNKSLENEGEFKLKVEPKIDFKIILSSDRKTAKITHEKPFELGTTYTFFIGTDTKFDGVGAWGQEKIFHLKTIKYRGV